MRRLREKRTYLKKGVLSVALSGALALGLCPASALATEGEGGLAPASVSLSTQATDLAEHVYYDEDSVYFSSTSAYQLTFADGDVEYLPDSGTSVGLKQGTDYTVSYLYVDDDYNETSVPGISVAGSYRIVFTGIGSYTGTDTWSIRVYDKNDIAASKQTNDTFWCFASTTTYKPTLTFAMLAPGYQVGATLKEGTDYTLQYVYEGTDYAQETVVNGLSKVGSYSVNLTGKGSYKGEKNASLRVGNLKVTGNNAQKYTGKAITPALKLVWDDGENAYELDASDYTLSYKNNINPGTATVTITGKGFYAGTATTTFAITGSATSKPTTAAKTSIAGAVVSGLSARTYTGKAQTPALALKLGSKTLKAGADYTVAYKNNVNAGTATVTVTGKGSYAGTKTATFKINKAANTMTAKGKTATVKLKKLKKKAQKIAANKAVAVGKAKGKVTYKKASGNKKITIAKAGKVTVKKGLKKGTYKVKVKVTAAGNANFAKATKTVTFKVNVK